LSDGRISYQGQVSSKALNEGHAFFNLNADFSNVAIDYGSPQSWPAIDRGRGKLKIVNELLTITSNEAYIGGDRIRDFDLQLPKLFNRNRKLSVQGKVTKSLSKVMSNLISQ